MVRGRGTIASGCAEEGEGILWRAMTCRPDPLLTLRSQVRESRVCMGSRGQGKLLLGTEPSSHSMITPVFTHTYTHTYTHTTRWYADLLISYLRDVASDMLTRRMAARLLGGQLPEGARQAWATGGEQPAVVSETAVVTEHVEEKRRQQLAPGLNGGGGDRRAVREEGEAAEAGGGAEAEEGAVALLTGDGGDSGGGGGGNTRCWAGILVEGNCRIQGGMGRSYKVGGGWGHA